jgi:hypothetical protein
LLDLSLRNPLLNYRPRALGLEFQGESAAQVFRVLVTEGKRLTFLPATENPGYSSTADPEGTSRVHSNTAQTDAKLQTDLAAGPLQDRLLAIFHAARTSLEEQGVNTLFLVAGMLRWFEADDREQKRPHGAPLLLVPVELERSGARERFWLRASEEDPAVNLSLIAKLRADFGIDLPEFSEGETDAAADLDAPDAAGRFFTAVESAVHAQDGWEVDREAVVLGFFSFGKFLMYRDLDESSWPAEARPCDHAILRALLHEGFREPPSADDDRPLDQILAPADLHQVVDADSTQLRAILDVSQGRNLLIQGPPGTGKSQTITNLIAAALGSGRTVLFVAEKLAALEVVKRRLDAVGLGAACLELHSHKTRKKAVLDELRRTMSLGKPRLDAIDDDLKMLDAARARLNGYCEAVNTPIGVSGVTPYDAYGALLKLRARQPAAPCPPLEIPGMPAWTSYDLKRRAALAGELQSRVAAVGVPRAHPFWGCRRGVLLPAETERFRALILAAQFATTELRAAADRLASALHLPSVTGRADTERLLRAASRAARVGPLSGADLATDDWTGRRAEIRAVLEAGTKLGQLHEKYDETLVPEAWDDDLRAVRQGLNVSGRRWWRLVSPSYRRAQRKLAELCRAAPPHRLDEQLELVDAVLAARRQREIIRRHDALATRLFGVRWQGEHSHWGALSNLSRWAWQLHHDVQARRLPAGILAVLAEGAPVEEIGPRSAALREALAAQLGCLQSLARALEFDGSLEGATFTALESLLQTWIEQLSALPALIGFNHLARRCRDDGLEALVAPAETWPDASRHLVDLLLSRWYEVLLAEAFAARPMLAGFDGRGHEHAIATFCALDRRVLRHNRARLALEHWQRLPRQEGGGQLAVLRREFEKKTRHLPLRTLLARAGNAVRAVKPVFLMSPLSVAAYLAPGASTFDLVIFDEASQVRPVEALGPLLRGRQAVVVGDSRQLPPTSFFDRLTGGDAELDDDDAAPTADVESILGLFAAMGAPERMLGWHYRSRHESLIAVANREFYDDRLIVFPSPDAARRERGLVLRHLPEAVYDRGGTRTNRVEAAAVAQAVRAHARAQIERPAEERLSLGVATFSMAQRQAIQDELERLRRDDPACEPFFAGGVPEPFFIKNLETVQGDERDVIYISVGYGRTADGVVAMGFGPLNGEGGERRLNVLITRARLRCEVFTSLTARDIDLSRTRARGVRALKSFLAYAENRPLDGDGRPSQSPAGAVGSAPEFEPMVSGRNLRGAKGDYEVESQPEFEQIVSAALTDSGATVDDPRGAAPRALDLAITDPGEPGRYALALLCDGPSYHAAGSARDRDRIGLQILESLGWRLRHVWSTDWVRNPEGELQRVLDAIEDSAPPARKPEPEAETFALNRADGAAALAPNGATAYQVARLAADLEGRDLAAVPAADLATIVARVVAVESPVHVEEVVRRVADAAGVRRLGNRLQRAIESACEDAARRGTIHRKGDFLWDPAMRAPIVRDRSALPGPSRRLELIGPEEISRAIEAAVAASFGIAPDALAAAVGRALGLARISDEFRARVDQLVAEMIAAEQLVLQGGQLVVAAGGERSLSPPHAV